MPANNGVAGMEHYRVAGMCLARDGFWSSQWQMTPSHPAGDLGLGPEQSTNSRHPFQVATNIPNGSSNSEVRNGNSLGCATSAEHQ
jgi:hypothetical protein